MKHFIIEMTYTVPADDLADTVAEHRAFLQTGYDCGWLLFSGPQVPRVGGIIVARAPTQPDLEQFFHDDPFQKKGLATYRFIEFNPVKFQPSIEPWLQG